LLKIEASEQLCAFDFKEIAAIVATKAPWDHFYGEKQKERPEDPKLTIRDKLVTNYATAHLKSKVTALKDRSKKGDYLDKINRKVDREEELKHKTCLQAERAILRHQLPERHIPDPKKLDEKLANIPARGPGGVVPKRPVFNVRHLPDCDDRHNGASKRYPFVCAPCHRGATLRITAQPLNQKTQKEKGASDGEKRLR
jgi:hypothetical protein